MLQQVFCPLCQPEAIEGEEKALLTETFDNGYIIECRDCGTYRLPNHGKLKQLTSPRIHVNARHQMIRLIHSENKLGFVARLDHQMLL